MFDNDDNASKEEEKRMQYFAMSKLHSLSSQQTYLTTYLVTKSRHV